MPNAYHTNVARERYAQSVSRAQLVDILGLIRGKDTKLASFEEVAKRLKVRQQVAKRMEFVPVEKIVGSVGRYQDFTREFLPRSSVNIERWTKLDAALNALETLPPVELYKIGDVYFVKDGNHRVSVARANGLDSVEAHVVELESPIPLTATDFERDQWISKAEYADFLQKTRLDVLRPEADLLLTVPGQYEIILHHIDVHGYLRNQELDRAGSQERLDQDQIVMSWYDNVYMPVVKAVRDADLLAQFPNRTEADLYLWIAKHREELARRYGLAPLSPDVSVRTFAETHSGKPMARTVKGLKLGFHRAIAGDDKPLGISDEEFLDARSRHDAGERSLSEAELTDDSNPEEELSDARSRHDVGERSLPEAELTDDSNPEENLLE